jgi:FHA domain
MSLLGIASNLESWIQGIVRKKLSRNSAPHQLEIRRAILDEIESRVQPIGNGGRIFPYQLLTISLHVQDDDRRYFLEGSFVEGDRLKFDIHESLRQCGCHQPGRLAVQIKFTDEANPAWRAKGFNIDYVRKRSDIQRPPAKLTVTAGQATAPSLEITKNYICIGRTLEVKDSQGHVVRRNDLVFTEISDEVNSSVSRAHAHIRFDESAGAFRLCDDNSAQGTYVYRNDRLSEVPRNSLNGIKLRSDDEIYFGKAVVIFHVDTE